MQFTILSITAILAALTSAAPAPIGLPNPFREITVVVSNDFTGASAPATVLNDGRARNLTDLFRNSAIDRNGVIVGMSAMLTKFTDGTLCFFQNYNEIIDMNGRDKSWVNLDGDSTKAIERDLNGFNLQCRE